MLKRVTGLAVIALLAFEPIAKAQGATVTQNLGVSLVVNAQCVLGAAPALNFPASALLSAAADAQATMSLQCTSGTAYRIKLGAGTGTGATTAQRRMKGTANAANLVNYNVFSDAARTAIWGDTTTAPAWVTGTGTGAAVSIPIYARVPQQTAAPDTYTDTIAITVEY
jgi:spore coat protein U-like protein